MANGATLTADAPVTVTGDMTIQSGVVTHSAYGGGSLPDLVLDVGGTLDVQSGGSIDVGGRGLRGGNNGSPYGTQGEAMNDAGEVIPGSTQNSGGSYGGRGGFADWTAGM